MSISIRPVQTIAEYKACEAIQHRAWGMADGTEVVPLHLLLTAQKNGGLLLGAFDGQRLVGFAFGFPGVTADGRLKHCSHMMGVLPGMQGRGVGYRLKLGQRAFALERGLELVTWTYDPLEGRNAYLNLHKLGAICRTYLRDLYGPMEDGLNAGLPSDRFEVEWWIGSERVAGQLQAPPRRPDPVPPRANVTGRTAAGLVAPGEICLGAGAPAVRVEIPADYQALKAADPDLALDWRLAMREVFEFYFEAGYVTVDFVSERGDGGRQSYYLLSSCYQVG